MEGGSRIRQKQKWFASQSCLRSKALQVKYEKEDRHSPSFAHAFVQLFLLWTLLWIRSPFFRSALVTSYSHYFVKSKVDLSPVGIPEYFPVPQCSRDLVKAIFRYHTTFQTKCDFPWRVCSYIPYLNQTTFQVHKSSTCRGSKSGYN